MSDQLNWFIIPSDNSVTTILPSDTHSYDLFNETVFQRVVYGSREYGINLVWDDPDPTNPSIRFLPLSGATTPITYGERVAIHVRGGGFLRYGEREYGINLKWSESPVYEWRLRGDNPPESTPVDLTKPVGLFNTVSSDYLFYDPRRYGINLKWVRDKGKYNSKPWYESVADAVTGFGSEVYNLFIEAVNRVIGAVDFVLTYFGIMLPKKVRIRFVILRDADGRAIFADDRPPESQVEAQQQQREQQLLDEAIGVIMTCCEEQLNTDLIAADGVLIERLPFPAPQNALHVHCGVGAFGDDFGDAGSYFRSHLAPGGPAPRALGYGAPITIFVVDDIEEKAGCSLGPLTDYVVVDRKGMQRSERAPEPRPTSPMHEIGHACSLWHPKGVLWDIEHPNYLMIPAPPRGIRLWRHQRAIARNSRHITFL